ncbi:MAG: alpha/beta hydrolase [Rhodobacteraceae bacterium]|nr:alpha/beta hydrolase [Paracoccaceae bacterium]
MRVLGLFLIVLVLAGGALWASAPGLHWPAAAEIAPAAPGDDLDAWLAAREGVFDDLTPGTQKLITWAGERGAETAIALVYLPGFSATRQEIAPVPQRVAEALGANLFETRFAGHGRPGAAMGSATAEDWATDLSEAMAIGERLGRRVVLMGTSTGGSIAVMAALDPAYRDRIAGIVLISPNFGVADPLARVLDLPWAHVWGPWIFGAERQWQPVNEAQGRYWTTRYPTVALFPMRTVQQAARHADVASARVPALVFYAAGDQVVDPAATEAVMGHWGAAVEMHVVTDADDPSQHVIAGDILSPHATAGIVATTEAWARAL